MNDAGTVIVADVYAAGEAPIPGIDRDALVEGLRARGHRSVVPLPGPEHLAEMVHAIARSGRFRGLPRRRQHHRMGRQPCRRSSRRCRPASRTRRTRSGRHDGRRPRPAPDRACCRPLRGRVQADALLAPTTWFRVGGPAEVLVRPADADDLAQFPGRLPLEVPVTGDRRRLQPDRPRRRRARRGDPPGARLHRHRDRGGRHRRRRRRARRHGRRTRGRGRAGRPGVPVAAFPAASAARWR